MATPVLDAEYQLDVNAQGGQNHEKFTNRPGKN